MIIYNWADTIKLFNIKGVIHIGAHQCEEADFYKSININDVMWIDANPLRDNVYKYLVSDKDNIEFDFNISNNSESSSLYNIKKHCDEYPDIYYTNTNKIKSITLDTIYTKNNIDPMKYNMWNICVQGSELNALRGGIKNIESIDIIYTKIYTKELYENNPIITDMDTFLTQYNFERILTEYTTNGWGNALYVKKKYCL
tara:strand:+ start:15 stop:611 length:597 start_codon:yes stop_codon:yes gene_type:complete